MAENISPEERLFKVIQQEKKAPSEKGKPGDKRPGGWLSRIKRLMPPASVAQPAQKKGFDWKKIVPAHMKLPELEPGVINRALAGILAVIVMLVIYASVSKRQDTTRISDAVSRMQTASAGGKERIEPFKEISYYLGGIRKRDIFRPTPKEAPVEVKQAVSDSLTKTAGDLKLQGIAWGNVPKAMILMQGDKEGRVYFLTKGQTIGSTGVKVKEIYRNKVMIGDDKEDMELL